MSAFEELLRKTLQQQGGNDASSREKIYQSARASLGRLLESKQDLSAEQIKTQKDNLEKSIRDLDAEYQARERAALPASAPRAEPIVHSTPNAEQQSRVQVPTQAQVQNQVQTPAEPQIQPQVQAQVQPQMQPVVAVPQQSSNASNQAKPITSSSNANATADGAIFNDKNRKHPFAKLMLWSTLVAFIAIGAWWAYDQQLFVPLSERDGAVPNPQKNLDSEDFTPQKSGASNENSADQVVSANGSKPIEPIESFPKVSEDYKVDDKGWTDVLDPSDPRGVILDDRGTAELLTENGEKILRLRSYKQVETTDQNERAIKIEIGNGLAESLAGKTVNLLLEMRSSDKDKHRISVVCAFGALGQCGRRWYQVLPEKQNILIEFELQDSDAQPGSNFLLIYTDDENMGKGVDIYGIKIMAK